MAPRPLKILQGNLNHCAAAQDLARQTIQEWNIDLAVFAEPYRAPERGDWLSDTNGLAVIVCPAAPNTPSAKLRERGRGYVACEWRGLAIVAAYHSPNSTLADFETFLGALSGVVHRLQPLPVIIAGDLNAKSEEWGSPRTDARGDALADWARCTRLDVVNEGSEWTCVRSNGGSIVDVTFASTTAARNISSWRVAVDTETLSDHRYVRFDIVAERSGRQTRSARRTERPRKWALRRLDVETMRTAATVETWAATIEPDHASWIDEEATRIGEAMTRCCDASMPRVGAMRDGARKPMYWWTEDIGNLRRDCIVARRRYLRQRRRRITNRTAETALHSTYVALKKALQKEIGRAKARAWSELLRTLDDDPWGRPFEIVRKKLTARGAANASEMLEPEELEHVLQKLFPNSTVEHARETRRAEDSEIYTEGVEVTEEELQAAVKGMRQRGKTAPGPDGIPSGAWSVAMPEFGPRLRALYSECLRRGLFPTPWKVGRLVLLQKAGRAPGTPGAYRPICILDETGKLLERILANRLLYHLGRTGPDLNDRQYGFRRGRSTVDAIRRVLATAERANSSGRVAIGVSLDIANAFNTIPWRQVQAALSRHQVPDSLQAVVGDYFRDRYVEYRVRGEETVRRSVRCGVPQGSVLGPLLWDMAYDEVLSDPLPPEVETVCFADDTFVVAVGDDWATAAVNIEIGVEEVIGRIQRIGLCVATEKCEAIGFRGPRKRLPRNLNITIQGAQTRVGDTLKYLGLTIDGRRNFQPHFVALCQRLKGEIGAFGRLMPNLEGPNDRCRKLYTAVVRSIAMYGAPTWFEKVLGSKKILAQLHGAQRTLNTRVMRGYRTVAYEATCAVAASPPWELVAEVFGRLYEWRAEVIGRGEWPTTKQREEQKGILTRRMMRNWAHRLDDSRYGRAAIDAIRPSLDAWCSRRGGRLNYHLVQVLTGHGCFGVYLHGIVQREDTPKCHHCDHQRDDVQHTINCPAWDTERAALVAVVGEDLSLPALVRKMTASREGWTAVSNFCVAIISQKEEAERQREAAPDAAPKRRRKVRRRMAIAT